jgi:hypothetical protein
MSKTHQIKMEQQEQAPEGGDLPAQDEVQSTPSDAGAETPAEESAKPVALGIGAFVRHLLKNSKKTNAEILELVLKTFEGSKTTPACIAWYKTDMRKKGLLDGVQSRGKNVVKEFSAEELAKLAE